VTSSSQQDSIKRASPRASKVREWIMEHIAQQDLRSGDRLPSERILCNLTGASRPIVTKAIKELVSEGILCRVPGSGTFVTEDAVKGPIQRARTIGLCLPFIAQDETGGLVSSMGGSSIVDPNDKLNLTALLAGRLITALANMQYRYALYAYNPKGAGELPVITEMAADGLDGVIAWTGTEPVVVERWREIVSSGLPVLFTDHFIPDIEVDCVVSDNFGGAREATKHLISRGHRRIAFFTGFTDVTSRDDREAGYKAALDEAGIPYDDKLVCGPSFVRKRQISLTPTLERCVLYPDPITAIIGENGDMVWGAIRSIGELGLTVGRDIEVAGFFDMPIPMGIPVSFGRVVQDMANIGETAASMLVERVEGRYTGEARHVVVPTVFIPGDMPGLDVPTQVAELDV
jgi:GntR family transcriptional regulator, arabinose operon transcriptional repressor